MQKSAVTRPGSSSLASIEVMTKNGDLYSFPAMDKEELKKVLPKGKHELPPPSQSTLAMVNASFAVLSVPFQIIKTITVDEEVWWDCPA